MSGPKHGSYINYREEIRQEINSAKGYSKEINKLLDGAESILSLGNEDRELINKYGKEEWDRESEEMKAYIEKLRQEVGRIEKELKVNSYNSQSLSRVRSAKSKIKKLVSELREKNAEFRKKVTSIVSSSREKAKELRRETEKELRNIVEPNISLIEEWSFSQKVSELKEAIDSFESVDFMNIEDERQKILGLYHELYAEALKNKKNFEIKKDTSDKLIESLVELNYTNIERSLDGGKLGKIIVKAEAPDGSWNLVYEVGNDGKLKAITPYDSRCYANLEDINKKLEDYGIQMDIKELQRTGSERRKDSQRDRKRG